MHGKVYPTLPPQRVTQVQQHGRGFEPHKTPFFIPIIRKKILLLIFLKYSIKSVTFSTQIPIPPNSPKPIFPKILNAILKIVNSIPNPTNNPLYFFPAILFHFIASPVVGAEKRKCAFMQNRLWCRPLTLGPFCLAEWYTYMYNTTPVTIRDK